VRVLHVTTEYPPIIFGGLGTAVGGLVRASARAGLNVAVLLVGAGSSPAYGPESSVHETARLRCDEGVLVYPTEHVDAIDQAIRFARAWRPDVLHVHVFWLAHVAFAIRQATGTPIVYTVHSLDRAEYEVGNGPPECLTQWQVQHGLIRGAQRIVALTGDERDLIEDYCGPIGARIRVVGNGIDDSHAARHVAKRRAVHDGLNVLFAGRFVERKGVRELLDAIPAVLAKAPSARFVLAGGHRHSRAEDVERYWLPESCRPHRDHIEFTGWLDECALQRWYAWADILAVPSWYEPFGMVILEGMLHGLAIVASDVGGPRAILRDGVTGVLCAPRDATSLAQGLIRLTADAGLRRRLGRNAARDVRLRWLFRNAVAGMRAVYEEAAGETRSTVV